MTDEYYINHKQDRMEWDAEMIGTINRLKQSGMGHRAITEYMVQAYKRQFTINQVECALRRSAKKVVFLVEPEKPVKTFKNLTIPMDDYMISCDHHAPYYSTEWSNKFLEMADRFQIKKHIIAGDFFDMNFVSKFPAEEPKDGGEEIDASKEALKLIDAFDVNYFIQGNHERRIGNYTEGRLRAEQFMRIYGQERFDKKIVYSLYDRLNINDEYMVLHPKSYSQISMAVSKRMAEKFHCNILNAHGHFVGLAYDRSGRYMCVDLGGMFDVNKIEYCSVRTTTHPSWNNGFGMIRNKRFYLFHKGTDWDFWLKENNHEADEKPMDYGRGEPHPSAYDPYDA